VAWGEGTLQSVALDEATKDETSGSEVELDFAELFQLYYPRIYRYLRYRVESQEDAEDLASVTFERAYTRREQFDAAKGAFSAWLFRIAHNVLANYFRTRQRRTVNEAEGDLPADIMTPDPSPESKVIQAEAIAGLMRSLKYLSERDQEVISLKFAGQLSNKEIGQVMGLNEKTVSVVLWRAMRRLQKQLRGEAS
jgi:RNA polymerase sigma-70 factor (ECF subfamily)